MMQTIKVGQLIDEGKAHSQTGPFGTQLKASEYVNKGIPVINVRNVGMGEINENSLEFISDEKAAELSAHLLQKNDIVFGRKGAIERHGLISNKQIGWLQGSDCIRLRILTPEHNARFISYFFRTKRHQQWMINLGSFGATMGSLNQDIINRIEIPDVSIEVQNQIASILSTYDKLIDNNNQRINLLEQMAEEIYKEWFVRLRFPGHKQTRIVDEVPDGWKKASFDDVAEYINGFAFKPEDWGKVGYPIIKIAELKNGVTDNTPRNDGKKIPEKLHIKNGDILFSWSAHLDVYIWGEGQGLLNQHLFKVVPNEEKTKCFLYFSLLSKMQHFRNLSNGATMQHIKRSELKRVFLLLPENGLAEKFDNIVQPQFEEILILKEKNKTLKQTRDLLLPRLMSGKLSVEHLLSSGF